MTASVTCPACCSTRVVEGPGYDRARCRCWQCGREFLFSPSTGPGTPSGTTAAFDSPQTTTQGL